MQPLSARTHRPKPARQFSAEANNMSEGPHEVIRQLRTLAHARLFGDGPWFARGETYDALDRKLHDMGLWEPDPDRPDAEKPSPLGAAVDVGLMMISFMQGQQGQHAGVFLLRACTELGSKSPGRGRPVEQHTLQMLWLIY